MHRMLCAAFVLFVACFSDVVWARHSDQGEQAVAYALFRERVAAAVRRDNREYHDGTTSHLHCGNRSTYWLPTHGVPRGIVALVHGFSVGNDAWNKLKRSLIKDNFGYVALRLPGHGYKQNGSTDPCKLPTRRDFHRYQDYARRLDNLLGILSDPSQERGVIPVYAVGHSLGGGLCTTLRNVDGHVLIAPFFRHAHPGMQFLCKTVRALDAVGRTIGQSEMLDGFATRLYQFWNPERRRAGHPNVTVDNLLAAVETGRWASSFQHDVDKPVLLISADDDTTSSQGAMLEYSQRVTPQKLGWYHFSMRDNATHSPLQHARPAIRNRTKSMIIGFLRRDLLPYQPPEDAAIVLAREKRLVDGSTLAQTARFIDLWRGDRRRLSQLKGILTQGLTDQPDDKALKDADKTLRDALALLDQQ